MRCQQCQFENMPGQKTCFKCGAVMEIDPNSISIYPARMAKWKKPVRAVARVLRRIGGYSEIKFTPPAWVSDYLDDSIPSLIMSVIPGLAHLFTGRFKEIRIYFLLWLIFLSTGLFFFGSPNGYILLALAVGMHTGIAVQYRFLKKLETVREKIAVTVVVLILFSLMYRYMPRLVVPNLDGGNIFFDIPARQIVNGDYFLSWRNIDQKDLKRGDLIFVKPSVAYNYRQRMRQSTGQTICQIVGLPGEKLEILNGIFFVNDQPLDVNEYPAVEWLQVDKYSAIIPPNSYFVNIQYIMYNHNIPNISPYINDVCIVKFENIESRVFMQWMPISRRGFINR
ncbi:MAG: hypothetical protein A2Y12_15975 [Planctomycetes bacterium GWF2_42_9]|nr:MAG: hypothetical protein A2Y12_15975 [Planctomycetes bacterium GWF2_42_9]HAL44319.1 hypothetical protein [Phycisphaerales bacterium]